MRAKSSEYLANIADKNNLRTYSQVSRFKVCPNSAEGQSWGSVKSSHERDSKDGWNRDRNKQTELVRRRGDFVQLCRGSGAGRHCCVQHWRTQTTQRRRLDERRGDLRCPPSRETHRVGLRNPSHYPGRHPSIRGDQYSWGAPIG